MVRRETGADERIQDNMSVHCKTQSGQKVKERKESPSPSFSSTPSHEFLKCWTSLIYPSSSPPVSCLEEYPCEKSGWPHSDHWLNHSPFQEDLRSLVHTKVTQLWIGGILFERVYAFILAMVRIKSQSMENVKVNQWWGPHDNTEGSTLSDRYCTWVGAISAWWTVVYALHHWNHSVWSFITWIQYCT